jgi:hypothetical protein
MEGEMRIEAIAATKRLGIGVCACALLVLGLSAWLHVGESAAARHCAPVVTSAGHGFTQASVLIVTGRTDCEKSRKVIYKALSTTSYGSKRINGWDCASTSKGSSGVFGARCTTEGEKGAEVIKSSVPKPCPGCHKTRD